MYGLIHYPDVSSLSDEMGSTRVIRMNFDYTLFKGDSVQLHDTTSALIKATQLGSLSSIKNVWPVRIHHLPEHEQNTNVIGALENIRTLGTHANTTEMAPFSPHVMTQVDKLHAKGITGKGVKVAILDTGVSDFIVYSGSCAASNC